MRRIGHEVVGRSEAAAAPVAFGRTFADSDASGNMPVIFNPIPDKIARAYRELLDSTSDCIEGSYLGRLLYERDFAAFPCTELPLLDKRL